MPHFVDDLLIKCWYPVDLVRDVSLQGPVLLAGRALALEHVVLQGVVRSLVLGRAPVVDGVALRDLLAHGDVVDCHQDGALVHVAADGVGVAAGGEKTENIK